MPAGELVEISRYMKYAQVTPFISNLPEDFKLLAPLLVDVLKKHSLGKADTIYSTVRHMKTYGHKKFTVFSKNKRFGK
ncbi:hypothetical protein TELCIR_26017, partial [Teladorsagia circumcincta]